MGDFMGFHGISLWISSNFPDPRTHRFWRFVPAPFVGEARRPWENCPPVSRSQSTRLGEAAVWVDEWVAWMDWKQNVGKDHHGCAGFVVKHPEKNQFIGKGCKGC